MSKVSEIILDAERDFGQQLREIFKAVPQELHHMVHTYPRPNMPHGVVVQVPEAPETDDPGPDGVLDTEDDPEPTKTRRAAKKAAAAKKDASPADQTPGATGDGGAENPKE